MEKREWHYILPPQAFECSCVKCNGVNLQWSEFKNHIWCYDCQIDFDPEDGEHSGLFSGPIPIQLTSMFGTSFDRYIINEDRVERFNLKTCVWDKDWTFDDVGITKSLLLDNLDDNDDVYGDFNFIKGSMKFKYENGQHWRKVLYEVLRKYKTKL